MIGDAPYLTPEEMRVSSLEMVELVAFDPYETWSAQIAMSYRAEHGKCVCRSCRLFDQYREALRLAALDASASERRESI